jgi:hypothetical protein
LSRSGSKRLKPVSRKILSGAKEPIFAILPASIQANFTQPASENALLWNLMYPLTQPNIMFSDLLNLRPLWGTHKLKHKDQDALKPFFWGYSLEGERLDGLDYVLEAMDGPGPRTEVDLFLVGGKNLLLVEAKNRSGLGRCSRYTQGRCPEIHPAQMEGHLPCRYWEKRGACFNNELFLDPRPSEASEAPACNRHYQLARTLMVGCLLSSRLGLKLHLWLILPRSKWASLEPSWLDFAQRVRRDELWRCMRVLAWEDVRGLGER